MPVHMHTHTHAHTKTYAQQVSEASASHSPNHFAVLPALGAAGVMARWV